MELQPIVIDNGSGLLKCGMAGMDMPKVIMRNIKGTIKHKQTMLNNDMKLDNKEFIYGNDAYDHRGLVRIDYAMEHGMVKDWQTMEKLWSQIYENENLNCDKEAHPVLLTEAALNPRKNREKSKEIFFENFNVPSMYVSQQATLSLYASGRTTGVVLDSGDGVTHCVPVYEGFTIPHAITRIDLAGRDVTNQLMHLLRVNSGYCFNTTAELEMIRQMKEEACYINSSATKNKNNNDDLTRYKLPDGQEIDLGNERYMAPEILFHPSIIGLEYSGIHECLANSIFKSDLDLRRLLFSQIVVAGGSTLYNGFGDRLLNEVRNIVQLRNNTNMLMKIKISAPRNRKYLCWMGGSILASLAAFKKMWITKEQYYEGSSLDDNN